MRRARPAIVALAAAALLAGCTVTSEAEPDRTSLPTAGPSGVDLDIGPRHDLVDASPDTPTVVDGDDWSLPEWTRPAPNSGYFSEEEDADELVAVRSVDVSWRQIQPTADGGLDRDARGEAQGLSFDGLDAQLQQPGDFWMRVFASGEDWAPEWVAADCGVASVGPDYDGQRHLPIWDECVWGHLLDTYRELFVDGGLADNPRLRFVYVPGAFTWAEYDYEMIQAAVDAGTLDERTYLTWYRHAWTDLVELFGDNAHKLVFTGEDYPFGPFGDAQNLLAKEAVEAGMGIRTGITELFNFHLSEAPAYGSHIQPDGHVTVDESLPIHSGRFVVGTENECYTDCGYMTDDPYYAVVMSNLKALQLRVNWMYVVPGPSYMAEYPEHWDWLRLSIGQKADTSADAWAALRDAEDRYWAGDDPPPPFDEPAAWPARPWVRNLERWLVQVDEPGSVAHRTDVDARVHVFEEDNGTAYEGLSTSVADGDTGFVFDVDERFAAASAGRDVVKVTFLDRGTGSFSLETDAGTTAAVGRTDSGAWRTATIALPEGALTAGTRLRVALAEGADDLVVRFVRVVHTTR